MQLRPYQRQAVDSTWAYLRAQPGNPCIVLPTGCHAAGTRVVMFDGSTKAVEDVQVGDRLMSPWSEPRTVLRLIHGREPLYRITPRKGSTFVVNGSHVLSLRTTNEGKGFPSSKAAGELESITVSEYLTKSKSWKHLRKLWRPGAVYFPDIDRPDLDPWALGALLGDGSIIYGVHFSNPDVEVLDALWAEMERHGINHRENYRGGCWHVQFTGEKGCKNPVFSILGDLGLAGLRSGEKFVPDCYKFGPYETRLAVLAGLLDTDGHHDGRGGFDFISKSKQLSEDVKFIAQSCGISAYLAPSEKCWAGSRMKCNTH